MSQQVCTQKECNVATSINTEYLMWPVKPYSNENFKSLSSLWKESILFFNIGNPDDYMARNKSERERERQLFFRILF